MAQKILVTGGTGYIGSHTVAALLERNESVVVIDNLQQGHQEAILGGVFYKGDIRDIDLLKKSLKGFDSVIHLACISNDPSFELDPELGKSINLDCFRPLVETAKDLKIKRSIKAITLKTNVRDPI